MVRMSGPRQFQYFPVYSSFDPPLFLLGPHGPHGPHENHTWNSFKREDALKMHADHAGFMRTTNSVQPSWALTVECQRRLSCVQDFRLADGWFRLLGKRREFSQKTDLSPADHSSSHPYDRRMLDMP
jgi:hypothetical protein